MILRDYQSYTSIILRGYQSYKTFCTNEIQVTVTGLELTTT